MRLAIAAALVLTAFCSTIVAAETSPHRDALSVRAEAGQITPHGIWDRDQR